MSDKKLILHLCADTGSDSRYYQLSKEYEVIKVGADIGVENFKAPSNVYGIIANPVCTEFSTARSNGKARNPDLGMELVNECLRIIAEAKESGNLNFWVIENPAKGRLKDYLGAPNYTYEPWWYGSPWTKKTSLWGEFQIPKRIYTKWEEVPKLPNLYIRPGRPKPSLAFMHKSAVTLIPEFVEAGFTPDSDMEFRSLCSQKFAKAFYESNR
jgi:hypothetical protein